MPDTRARADEELAIIGMAGRFPGADDIDAFWQMLCAGREGLARIERQALLAAGLAPARVDAPDYVPVKGVLADADCFDARFFGLSPRDARLMDPQHRVFLEAAWHALEHAGYRPDAVGQLVGVYAGCSLPGYLMANLRVDEPLFDAEDGYFRAIANDKDFLATRVAWHLGLEGPAIDIQTGCSTSLVAVIQACTALLTWQCDVALAGGVSVTPPLAAGYVHRPGGIFSPDGHCRPFDARAGGTVCANGVGVVVLKRLVDAQEAGDTIHGIIRGFGLNNDGRHKVGFTAPSVRGQALAIGMAHGLAGVTPDDITYVEAHGTATALGDPVEIAALNRAFDRASPTHRCAIGSVKGNIGHLDAAAGVAALIKTTLAVRCGVIPATAHFDSANPEIPLADGPFFVQRETGPWRPDGPRIAGVSSFGIGGTNAHVVVEAPPPEAAPIDDGDWHVWPVSGRTPAAAERLLERLDTFAASERAGPVSAVADTLRLGRRAFAHRSFRVARRPLDRGIELAPLGGRVFEALDEPRVAFLFPGQGAQRPGMGRALYRREPVFRRTIDRCARVARRVADIDLHGLLYPPPDDAEAAAERLRQTRWAQPALFATELAWARLWSSIGVRPTLMLGHSLGEWVAATLAGVFDPDDAMRLVLERGRLMQAMAPGAMLSVAAEASVVAEAAIADVEIAAINAPGLVVAAGPFDAIEALERALERSAVACRRLVTSHAFHSRAMEPMLEAFARAVAAVERRSPQRPFISNVTGEPITEDRAVDPRYWARQIRERVRFADGLRHLPGDAATVCIEVGPGRGLGRLAATTLGDGARVVHSTHPAAPDDRVALLTAAAEAWCHGVDADLTLGVDRPLRRVPAPTYPFARERHWVDARSASAPTRVEAPATPAAPPLVADDPRSLTALVAAHMADALGVSALAADDDFYDLGGHSLLAVGLSRALFEATRVRPSLDVLIRHSTPARLAAYLEAERARAADGPGGAEHDAEAREEQIVIHLRDGRSDHPPIFLLHPAGGLLFGLHEIARRLDPAYPVYLVQPRGMRTGQGFDGDMQTMAARYLRAIRRVRPRGPYRFVGHSFGGAVAYEMARRLRAMGEDVDLLVMLDTFLAADTAGFRDAVNASHERFFRDMSPQAHTVLQGLGDSMPWFGELYDLHYRVVMDYTPQPSAGPVTFFRARERDRWLPDHPELSWYDLAEDGLEVVNVAGNHISMVSAPHVDDLVHHLHRLLRRCDA